MIKRLRSRFIRIATLSVAAVMLLLTVILNVVNYVSTDSDLRSTLTLIYENQGGGLPDTGDVPPPEPPQGGPNERDGHFTPETPFSTRYFVLRYKDDGTLVLADLTKIASVTDADTAEYLTAALKNGEGYGRCGSYRFFVAHTGDDQNMAIFLDSYQQFRAIRLLLLWSLLADVGCTLLVLLLAALGLLAVELILAGVCIARGTALTLSGSSLETALQHSFRAGIIALQVLLASSLGSNSRYSYTLQRLRVSERCVFLWSCVCNTLCFAVLWCVQIMAAVGAAFWNAKSAVYSAGPQGVFVDFYRSGFLHGLLPLADGYGWARNALFVLALGCVTAYMQLGIRRKGSRSWLVCMGLTLLLVLCLPVQYGAGRSTGIFHAIAALLVGLGFLGFGLTQTHNGKDGLADEVE